MNSSSRVSTASAAPRHAIGGGRNPNDSFIKVNGYLVMLVTLLTGCSMGTAPGGCPWKYTGFAVRTDTVVDRGFAVAVTREMPADSVQVCGVAG